jgi:hypothetical protein
MMILRTCGGAWSPHAPIHSCGSRYCTGRRRSGAVVRRGFAFRFALVSLPVFISSA